MAPVGHLCVSKRIHTGAREQFLPIVLGAETGHVAREGVKLGGDRVAGETLIAWLRILRRPKSCDARSPAEGEPAGRALSLSVASGRDSRGHFRSR